MIFMGSNTHARIHKYIFFFIYPLALSTIYIYIYQTLMSFTRMHTCFFHYGHSTSFSDKYFAIFKHQPATFDHGWQITKKARMEYGFRVLCNERIYHNTRIYRIKHTEGERWKERMRKRILYGMKTTNYIHAILG